MAVNYKCDRCGKEISDKNKRGKFRLSSYYKSVLDYNVGDDPRSLLYLDLCDECGRTLYNWAKSKGELK